MTNTITTRTWGLLAAAPVSFSAARCWGEKAVAGTAAGRWVGVEEALCTVRAGLRHLPPSALEPFSA